MRKRHTIELDDRDLFQLLDALQIRANSRAQTAVYLRSGGFPEGEFFVIEDSSKPEEADGIAEHYRSIISKIQKQMETQ